MLTDLLAFAGVLALGQFSPGPDMVLLTQTSLRHGRVAGWWTTLGITSGLMVHAALALGGLVAIGTWPAALQAGARCAAAVYLLWLARAILRDATPAPEDQSTGAPAIPAARFFRRGLLCNLTNPKVLVFFAALTAPFLGAGHSTWWPLALWLVLVIEGLVLWGLWVAVLQHPHIRALHARSCGAINRTFAVMMVVLAAVLFVEAARVIRG